MRSESSIGLQAHTLYSCTSKQGIGKRYQCNDCNFDMHEYCATCPRTLSSFMDPHHKLNLVVRKSKSNRQIERICNICSDPVEGLFYRCELCEFDVHPLCTQLPETLRHALHQEHPLRLLGSSATGICAVCRGTCAASSWRYRCALCGLDIHMGCVLVQCEKNKTSQRGIPSYVPPSGFPPVPPSGFPPGPQYFGGYGYGYGHGVPYWNHNPNPFGSNNQFDMHHNYMHQPQPQPQSYGPVHTHNGGVGRIGQMMFGIVQTLSVGVISNMLFGMG